MIALLQGEIRSLTHTSVVILLPNGIGYLARISLETYNELNTYVDSGSSIVQLLTEEVYRADQPLVLVGFFHEAERKLFKNLLKINGVGINMALLIISGLGIHALINISNNLNEEVFRSIKGIGQAISKQLVINAEKIVFGLTELDIASLPKSSLNQIQQPQQAKNQVESNEEKDAITALVSLGFTKTQAKSSVTTAMKKNPSATVQELIKQSLQQR